MAETQDARRLEYLPIDEVIGADRNPKQHSGDIPVSIRRFGFTEPILMDERTGKLVAGHGRLQALRQLKAGKESPPQGVKITRGQWMVPVIRGWASRSDTEADAYLVASNRLTEAGGWDNQGLYDILAELHKAAALDGTGYNPDDLSQLLKDLQKESGVKGGLTDADDVPEVDDKEIFVKPGELWVLGEHRILCGDSTKTADVDRVMAGEKATICWTDPPWNVAYGADGDHPSWKKREILNDNLGAEFPAFCKGFVAGIARSVAPGALLYMAMSAQEWPVIHGALTAAGFHWSSTIIWAKDSLVLSRKDYHTQYEPIWYGWDERGPRLCPLEDRTQSDVWNIARPKKSEEHPTMKPVELVARSLANSSAPGALVFEPFSGSGTTILAGEQTSKRVRAIELAPKYVQVAIERWQAYTGLRAELAK